MIRAKTSDRTFGSHRAPPFALEALERIDRRQMEDLRELVERAPRFVEERRVAQVGGRETVTIVSAHPALELCGKRFVEEHARRNRVAFRGVERDSKPQTCGSAAVAHALPQIERHDLGNRSAVVDECIEVRRDAEIFAALGGSDQQVASCRTRQKLAVEKIGCDGVSQ